MTDIISGGKDALRAVPILGGMLGLTSPEEQAERRLQQGLAQAGQDLRGGYGAAQAGYGNFGGLAQSLPGLQERIAGGQYNVATPEMEQFNFDFEQDPGQQWAMQQGQGAIENMLSARGLTGSGREMKEMGRFNTGLAGQQYGANRRQAFNEYQGRQQNRMGLARFGQNQLQNQMQSELGMGRMGLGVIGNQANLHTGLARGLADLSMGRGQVGASSIMGQAGQTRGMLGEMMKIAPKAIGAMSGNPAAMLAGGSAPYAGDPYQAGAGMGIA